MVPLLSLWLPIVVAGLVVWMATAVVWMFLPHRKNELSKLPTEDAVMNALRSQGLTAGQYVFPRAGSPAAMKDPAYRQKLQQGPAGIVTVAPPGWGLAMGGQMVASFVYCVVVSFIVAYVASRVLAPGAEYLAVFQVVGTTAWLGYGFSGVPDSIWFARPWSSTIKTLVEALAYGALAAGVFGWLWP